MRQYLQSQVEPFLIDHGWKGKRSTYKRISEGQCQTLQIQFNKWGGSFAVNLGIVEPVEDFDSVKAENLKIIRSQRLGSRSKRIACKRNMDHWFNFMRGFLIYIPAYQDAASKFIKAYEKEADLIFQDMQTSIDTGVYCIHLANLENTRNSY